MKNKHTKAFIFDMDGVIIDSEPVWERYEQKFIPELMGADTYAKVKDQILGNSVSGIYKAAVQCGIKITENEFDQTYDRYAEIVYKEAKITDGIQELITKLISMNFTLGLVSSSRQYWIDLVLKKLVGIVCFDVYFRSITMAKNQNHFPMDILRQYNYLDQFRKRQLFWKILIEGYKPQK